LPAAWLDSKGCVAVAAVTTMQAPTDMPVSLQLLQYYDNDPPPVPRLGLTYQDVEMEDAVMEDVE
jgi:hypothetical protein